MELFLPPGEGRRLPALLAALATPLLLLVPMGAALDPEAGWLQRRRFDRHCQAPPGERPGPGREQHPMPTLRSARRRAGGAAWGLNHRRPQGEINRTRTARGHSSFP